MSDFNEIEYTVKYPFVFEDCTTIDETDYFIIHWRPGHRSEFEQYSQWDGETHYWCHAWGAMKIVELCRVKPSANHMDRVLYKRYWHYPCGRTSRNSRLHIATSRKFNDIIRGYAYDCEIALTDIKDNDMWWFECSEDESIKFAINSTRPTPKGLTRLATEISE